MEAKYKRLKQSQLISSLPIIVLHDLICWHVFARNNALLQGSSFTPFHYIK